MYITGGPPHRAGISVGIGVRVSVGVAVTVEVGVGVREVVGEAVAAIDGASVRIAPQPKLAGRSRIQQSNQVLRRKRYGDFRNLGDINQVWDIE